MVMLEQRPCAREQLDDDHRWQRRDRALTSGAPVEVVHLVRIGISIEVIVILRADPVTGVVAYEPPGGADAL
jgi:hypothetical protein